MKFTFEGVEYRIEFQYDTKKTGKKKVRNYTTCRIVTGNTENQQIVASGTVARYHYDTFNKEEARKYALDAALELTSRDFRRAARTAYHRRPGGIDYNRAVRKGLIVTFPVLKAGATAGGVTIESIKVNQ
jgi:hypothetical protein